MSTGSGRCPACGQDAELLVGAVADVQYAERDGQPKNGRHYARSIIWLRSVVDVLNHAEVDVVVNLGDLIERDPVDARAIHHVLARSKAPVFHVLGNHDLKAAGGSLSEALTLLHMTDPFYDLGCGAIDLVVLNTTEDYLLSAVPGSEEWSRRSAALADLAADGAVNAHPWNGAVGAVQLAWLVETLGSLKARGRSAVVLTHSPLYPMSRHCTLHAEQVLRTLDRFPSTVLLVVSGHQHQGGFALRNGVAHLVLKGLVECATPSCAVLSVHADHICIQGHGDEPSRRIRIPVPMGSID